MRLRQGTAIALVATAALAAPRASAQSLLLDRAHRAAGLWCFPVVDRPHDWRYLPADAKISRDAAGNPELSFIRYVKVTPSAEAPAGGSTITEAEGGGVLHLLVLYETDPKKVQSAQAELRRDLDDKEILLGGPVVFSSGRYAVISSILPTSGGEAAADASPVRKLLRSGDAPVLEGNKLALSFDLDKTQAALLNQSFKMAKPDVSISFDMKFAGLTDPYDATIDVNWDMVHHSQSIGGGVSVYFVSADVKVALEELTRNGAVKVTSRGENANMEGLLNTAYAKVMDLLFAPVPDGNAPAAAAPGLLSLLGAGMSGGSAASWFSIHGSYELKELRTSGRTTIDLNHQSAAERHTLLTVNVGELYSKYGNNPQYFKTANLFEDAVFQKRNVLVALDGSLLPEFGAFVSSVTVTLKKQHQDGTTTLGESVITKSTAAALAEDAAHGALALTYGYAGDDDREAWLRYDYRTRWNFQGGAAYDTPWAATDGPMISVFAPYQHRTVEIFGDPAILRARGVTHAVVKVTYPFFGTPRSEQVLCRVGSQPIEAKIDVTLPLNTFATQVHVTWYLAGGRFLTETREDSSGLVLLDEIPSGGHP
jgi:hypothetical protein